MLTISLSITDTAITPFAGITDDIDIGAIPLNDNTPFPAIFAVLCKFPSPETPKTLFVDNMALALMFIAPATSLIAPVTNVDEPDIATLESIVSFPATETVPEPDMSDCILSPCLATPATVALASHETFPETPNLPMAETTAGPVTMGTL